MREVAYKEENKMNNSKTDREVSENPMLLSFKRKE